jgi:hypothetical protein
MFFAINVGYYTSATGGIAGSYKIWTVTFQGVHDGVDVAKITDIPEAMSLDGMYDLPSSSNLRDILAADIKLGVVFYVSIRIGNYEVAINNSLIAATNFLTLGNTCVNEIHVHEDKLYLTNTGQGTFGKLPIDLATGTATGGPTAIAHVFNTTLQFDDFDIQGSKVWLVTVAGNSIEKIGLDGTPKGRIIGGSLNSTEFAQPTSCAFGRTDGDSHILYVVTAGGLLTPVDGDIVVGAQFLAVDTRMGGDMCEY